MGEVYRAHDTRLLRDVALKVLPASFLNDPERLRRFEQEARAVAALSHPNIVSVYDVGATGDVHYIVSELLEGETLRQRILPSGMAGAQGHRTRRTTHPRPGRGPRSGLRSGVPLRNFGDHGGATLICRAQVWASSVVAALVLLGAGLAVGVWLRPATVEIHPKLHRITFRRGTISSARFTPDGNLIYGAAWEGHPIELFAAQPGSTESRPLGIPFTNILAV
jgi:Protein kinase domain